MGIILKQTFKGTIYSYLGVLLGFITTAILFPRFLSTKEIGLVNNLVAYSLIISQLFSLGFNNVTNRLFPYFRNNEKSHNGFTVLLSIVLIAGALFFVISFPVIKKIIIGYNEENAFLFNKYIQYLIPIAFGYLLFSIFDNYLKALYNATLGIFFREFFQRILILVATLLFAYNLLDFNNFVCAYTFSLLVPTVAVFGFLIFSKQFPVNIHHFNSKLFKKLKKEIFTVSLFGILGGLSTMIIMSVDKIMLAHYLGLDDTGIYSVLFYFGTLVLIPSRALLKISITIIAEAWKKNDLNQIKNIYYKSCLNQFIIGLIIFLGIWINIDNIFHITSEEFVRGKYIIFFIGLTNLIDMATGANGIIIGTSKYFRYQTYFNIFLGILTITTNIIFIPRWGLNGAAIATLISGLIYNLARFLFLYIRFKLQPFNYRFILITIIGVLLYFSTHSLISLNNYIIDIGLKSIILGSTYFIIIYLTNLSKEFSNTINNYLHAVKNLFKKFKR